MRQINTADHARTTAEQARHLEMNGVDNGDYARPHHSNTEPTTSTPFPTASASTTANGSAPSDLTVVDEKEGDRPESRDTKSGVNEKTHVPRKRKKFLGILGQPDRTDEDADLERTDTQETKKRKRHAGPWEQFKAVLFGSWVNVLLICVPVGFAVRYAHLNGYALFVINFVAIVPLAALLSFATEELALYVGETLGGLLNATFGNATELIGTLSRIT